MNIIKATIILRQATVRIFLETNLPCPFTREGQPDQRNLTLQFDATYDTGEKYVRTNFPQIINREVIDVR